MNGNDKLVGVHLLEFCCDVMNFLRPTDTLLDTLTTSLARPSLDGKVTKYNKVWVGGTKKVRRPQAESACVRAELTLTCDLDK